MPDATIYLDESGDLGWTFDKPYRSGGSSRHLTLAAALVLDDAHKYINRLVRDLYSQYGWSPKEEMKWSGMTDKERIEFARKVGHLKKRRKEAIQLFSITVHKPNVQEHIRSDENKIYNYMLRLLLADKMSDFDFVELVPDERSIKVNRGQSLEDYLQTYLWMDLGAKTQLDVNSTISASNQAIQFTDMLAGSIQHHFEDGRSDPWAIVEAHITSTCLFFP